MTELRIPVSLDTLAIVSKKRASELLSALTTENDDKVKVPIEDQKAIDTFISESYGDNIRSIVSEKGEDQYKRGIREANEKLEKRVKDELGIDTRFDTDGFSKIQEHFSKPSEHTEDDVKNSELFRNTVRDLNDQLEAVKKETSEKLKLQHQTHVKDLLINVVDKIVKKDDYKLSLSENEKQNARLMAMLVDELQDDNTILDFKDGKWMVLDKDGRPKQDDKFRDVSFENYVVNKAKDGIFPEMVNNTITTHAPGVKPDSMTVKVNDKEEVFKFPEIKDEESLMQWTIDNTGEVPAEMIAKVTEVFYNEK